MVDCTGKMVDVVNSETERVVADLGSDGFPRMVDYTGNMVDKIDNETGHVVVPAVNENEAEGKETIETATGDVKCDLCDQKQESVPTANICSECDSLKICKDCSTAHGMNKATRDHILTPFRTKREGKVPTCKMHHKLLIRFCLTCKEPVCKICVSLDHPDHVIERLTHPIKSKAEEVRVILEAQGIKMNDLQQLQKEYTLLNAKAPLVDKRDILIKEIKDHAQKCIDHIVTWKENLMEQVQEEYKLIQDIPVGLEKVSKMVQKLDRPINTATHLLSEIEEHPAYLDQLVSVQQELQAIPQREDGTSVKEFQSRLLKLSFDNHFFSPDTVYQSFGRIEKTPETTDFDPQEIFQHKMQVASEDMYIPCVAVLGHKYYAVAHPVKLNQQAEAIDIYEFPGTLKNTLRDHVQPLYDMTGTPEGKLAVLSDGAGESTCSVKLLDPETGYISSTLDIDVTEPLSLGVTLKQEYVILSDTSTKIPETDDDDDDLYDDDDDDDEDDAAAADDDDDDDEDAAAADDNGDEDDDDDNNNDDIEDRLITIVDKDGVVKYNHPLTDRDIDDVTCFNKITCGGSFIFVMGRLSVAVFEIQDTGLQKIITTCPQKTTVIGMVVDISATMWDELFLTDVTGNTKGKVYLTRLQDKENKLQWQDSNNKAVHKNITSLDCLAQISTRDGHTVVMSHGQTIRVFKC